MNRQDVQLVKYAKGELEAEAFENGGTEVVKDENGKYTFTVSEKDWYTVYAKVNSKSFTVKKIDVEDVAFDVSGLISLSQSPASNVPTNAEVTVTALLSRSDAQTVKWAAGTLIDNSTSGGYLFATTSESTETNNVKGTGKTMWNGTNNSWAAGTTLENLGQVCLKLTCKVWNGTVDNKYYYLGDNANYGVMYIPLTGTLADPTNVSTFEAGKRYTYNIVFKDNVGLLLSSVTCSLVFP